MSFASLCMLAFAAWSGAADAEMEQFLKKAKIVRTQPAPGGITKSKRVTLSDGTRTHDAHVQQINRDRAREFNVRALQDNFIDSWRGNVAAYRLDRLLGLGMSPVSVERRVSGVTAAVTWWVDDVMMPGERVYRESIQPPDKEQWRRQNDLMRLFDALIANPDRNANNLLVTQGWQLKLIDHTRAFRWNFKLEHPHRVTRCDRRVFAALRRLDRAELARVFGGLLTGLQMDALLARREAIVALLEQRIAERGEDAVLFDLRPEYDVLTLARPRPVEAVLPLAP